MRRWKCNEAARCVVAVECAEVGYPHKDADGFTQFDNTHFDSEADAWCRLLSEFAAGVSLSVCARADAERALEKCTTVLADDATALEMVKRNYDAWLAQRLEVKS